MVSFRLYVAASLATAVGCFYHAMATRKQFYPAMVYLSTAKANVVMLTNLAFMLGALAFKLLQTIFLGSLSRAEMDDVASRGKYAFTELLLALTIFRQEVDKKVLVLFAAVLAIKAFHWLAAHRVEYVGRSQEVPRSTHIRITTLLAFLFCMDGVLTYGLYMAKPNPSVLYLFAFEFLILFHATVSLFFKYLILVVDSRFHNRWEAKSTFLFYLEFLSDLTRLLLFIGFFLMICMNYGIPLFMIREVYITLYHLHDRVRKFILYRKITRNMNERFPDALPSELEEGDRTCIVCRDEMESGKKLPCGHIFHLHCIRSWIEQSQSCPTCRTAIPIDNEPAAAAAAAGQNANNAAAAAAFGVPAPQGGAAPFAMPAQAQAHAHPHHAHAVAGFQFPQAAAGVDPSQAYMTGGGMLPAALPILTLPTVEQLQNAPNLTQAQASSFIESQTRLVEQYLELLQEQHAQASELLLAQINLQKNFQATVAGQDNLVATESASEEKEEDFGDYLVVGGNVNKTNRVTTKTPRARHSPAVFDSNDSDSEDTDSTGSSSGSDGDEDEKEVVSTWGAEAVPAEDGIGLGLRHRHISHSHVDSGSYSLTEDDDDVPSPATKERLREQLKEGLRVASEVVISSPSAAHEVREKRLQRFSSN